VNVCIGMYTNSTASQHVITNDSTWNASQLEGLEIERDALQKEVAHLQKLGSN
jgi:hypothetical protein